MSGETWTSGVFGLDPACYMCGIRVASYTSEGEAWQDLAELIEMLDARGPFSDPLVHQDVKQRLDDWYKAQPHRGWVLEQTEVLMPPRPTPDRDSGGDVYVEERFWSDGKDPISQPTLVVAVAWLVRLLENKFPRGGNNPKEIVRAILAQAEFRPATEPGSIEYAREIVNHIEALPPRSYGIPVPKMATEAQARYAAVLAAGAGESGTYAHFVRMNRGAVGREISRLRGLQKDPQVKVSKGRENL